MATFLKRIRRQCLALPGIRAQRVLLPGATVRTFGPAVALFIGGLAILAIVALALFFFVGAGTVHREGGCNHIPLVNGQPAYACTNTPGP